MSERTVKALVLIWVLTWTTLFGLGAWWAGWNPFFHAAAAFLGGTAGGAAYYASLR